MESDINLKIEQVLVKDSAGRYKYTRQAFEMLPSRENPSILDIGCGSGGPTRELTQHIVVRLSLHRACEGVTPSDRKVLRNQ